MKWQIEIDGKPVEQTFATEDEANQHAANLRGNDWSKKIEVRDLDAPKHETPPPAPQASPVVAPAVLTKPADQNRK